MKAYYEIIKIALKNTFAYRLDTWINVFGSMISMTVQIYLWKALYAEHHIEQLPLDDMIAYQILGTVLRLLYVDAVAREVGNRVLDGSISMELIRPYNFAVSMFFRTLGSTLSGFIVKGIPVIGLVMIFFPFRVNTSLLNVLILLVVVILNILIYWLLHYMIGLLHFTFLNAGWFVRILRDTIRTLGGGVIPLWFFPDVLKKVSYFLPFQLLYQFPQSLFVNQITAEQLALNLIAEGFWIAVLALGSCYLWKLGVKKLVIQGG